MEKQRTNNGPLKELADKHSIYTLQRNALRAVEGGGKFRELLGADADIVSRLSPADIDRCFDLDHHLRHAGAIIDRALADQDSNTTGKGPS